MIFIPRTKWNDILAFTYIPMPDHEDYKEYYRKNIQDMPFVGEFDQGDWTITQLKIDIHNTLPPYKLFAQYVLGDNGIEEYICIDFEDKNQELLFKLKYL